MTEASVSTLRAHTSTRTKALILALTLLATLSRVGLVAIAFAVAKGDVKIATILGAAATAVALAQRLVSASTRVAVECDAFNSVGRSLLQSDVLEVSPQDTRRTVGEGMYYAQDLLAATLPLLAADAAATILLAPVIANMAPPRAFVLATVVLVIVLGFVFALRRVTGRIQERFLDARTKLHDTFSFAIEGRLELVARGGEHALRVHLAEEVAAYAKLARHSTIRSALLGRAPLAAGIVAVAIVMLVDGSAREAVVGAVMASILVLGACVPPALGVVLGAHALSRGLANVQALVEILTAAPRADIRASDNSSPKIAVALPATYTAERIGFRYDNADANAPLIFDDISFEWNAQEPLVLTGLNGSGKSTLLRLLIGLRPPTKGAILVDGKALSSIDLTALRQRAAYVPQRPYLGEPHVTIRQAMQFFVHDAADADIIASLRKMMLLPALGEHPDAVLARLVGELSVGQRQRVALARSLLGDSRMFLFDEPDANLDRDGVALIVTIIEDLRKADKMVAVAAHTRELADLSKKPIRLG